MVHSSCPKCPDDFKVKNIPSEVECLVAAKNNANDGALNLNPEIDYVEVVKQQDASGAVDGIINTGPGPIQAHTFDALDDKGLFILSNETNKVGLFVMNC